MARRTLAAFALAFLAAFLFLLTGGGPGATAPFTAATADAQEIDHARLVEAKFEAPSAARGGKAVLRIRFEIDDGYHMYPQTDPHQSPKFKWAEPAFLAAGELTEVTKAHEIESFGAKTMVFERELVLTQEFTVAADAPVGPIELKGSATWQYCDDNACYPSRAKVSAAVNIVAADGGGAPVPAPPTTGPAVVPPAGVPPAVPPPAVPPPSVAPPAAAPVAGAAGAAGGPDLGELLLKAIVAGFLTILTPCVFPLLPVTVSFFSKQKGAPLPRSVVYALGIIFTITVIGLVFSSTIGGFARGWVFNAIIGVLFLVLSLSLFGLFDLRVPSFLLDWSSAKAGGGGLVGAFFMAVTLALTSFSCSMPFLAVMLEDFARGDRLMAVTGLVVYSGTLAAPFFLCSLFPTALQSLPRAGEWMNAVKVVMGFVEFGLAFKFFRTVAINFESDALPRTLVLAIWTACAIGAAIYLLGFVVLPHDTKVESIGVFRLVFALAFLSCGLYLTPGIYRKQLANWIEAFIQTNLEHDIDGFVPIPWVVNDFEGSLARAAEKRRPVLFDFTGDG